MIDLTAPYRSRFSSSGNTTPPAALPAAPVAQPGPVPSIAGWTDTQKAALASHIASLAVRAGRGQRIAQPPAAAPEPTSNMSNAQKAEAILRKWGRWHD